jgi:hypothetical protein
MRRAAAAVQRLPGTLIVPGGGELLGFQADHRAVDERKLGEVGHGLEVAGLQTQLVHRAPIERHRLVGVADGLLEAPTLEALEALLGPIGDTMLNHGQNGQVTGVEQPPWQRPDWSQRLPLCLRAW